MVKSSGALHLFTSALHPTVLSFQRQPERTRGHLRNLLLLVIQHRYSIERRISRGPPVSPPPNRASARTEYLPLSSKFFFRSPNAFSSKQILPRATRKQSLATC